MKPREAELVAEISKLQCMVTELKTGFSGALMELSHIQQGDSFLREELEESRRSCQKKALGLEALVESLREELDVMRRQIEQLYSNRYEPQQDGHNATSKHRPSDPAEPPPSCLSRGKRLLHSFLQGLKVGLGDGTDARHEVAMQLLSSEWDYVLTLNQLKEQYHTTAEPPPSFVRFVEQLLQRHVLFRNSLQERLFAEHWKSLLGDVLVQLIGQNDLFQTRTLDTRPPWPRSSHWSSPDCISWSNVTKCRFLWRSVVIIHDALRTSRAHCIYFCWSSQSGQAEREEMKLISSLLAPVARLHSYLSHIQKLLQQTGKEHPDCSLLFGSERALRGILSRCHVILEEDARWEEEEGPGQSSSCDAAASDPNCCTRSQQMPDGSKAALQRDAVHLTNGVDGPHAMRLECWSCSPVRRKGCRGDWTALKHLAYNCGHARCSLLTPDAAGWGETSDSGQGTLSQPTRNCMGELEAQHANHCPEETDPDDTSAFDYSSVTSCSPDGTLHQDLDSNSGEDEDSQVPVLLKPSYSHRSKETTTERTVCLRWQIPRLTPHPSSGSHTGPPVEGPGLLGKRLVSVRRGSPPLHPNSAFRPIWENPSKQETDSAPEKDTRAAVIQIPGAGKSNGQTFFPSRENLRAAQHRGDNPAATSSGGLWDSEDSEGPCSTV